MTTTTVKSPCFTMDELVAKPEVAVNFFKILGNRVKLDGGMIQNVELVKQDHQPDEWVGKFYITLTHAT